MKAVAQTIEQLFDEAGNLKQLMIDLDEIITNRVPLKRQFFESRSMTAIAYGLMPYKTKTVDSVWPLIGLAPQKHTVNLYIMAVKNNEYLPVLYKDKLGVNSMGKSCLRFKTLKTVNLEQLNHMLDDAVAYYRTKMEE